MKTRDELIELVKDSIRLDWLELNMQCRTQKGLSDGWIWDESALPTRDLRRAVDAAMATPEGKEGVL